MKALKRGDLKRVNVGTTVMENNISYPTDGKLYYRGIEKLVHLARAYGIVLRQSYLRVVGATPEKIFMDNGYRGHDYKGTAEVYLPGQHRKRGATSQVV